MTKKNLKILLLEDNKSDALLLKRQLKKKWDDFYLLRVFDAVKFTDALKKEDWDLIISDYSMPQFTGLDALNILHDLKIDLPFIMVSGKMGEEVAVNVMREGAKDYILKDKIERLVPTIERELAEFETRKQNIETKKALEASEIALKKTFSSIRDSIMLINTDSIIMQCNPTAINIFEKAEDEIVGKSYFDLLERSKDEQVNCPFHKALKYKRRESGEFKFHDRWYKIYIDPIWNDEGDIISVVHIMKDISERIQFAQLQKTVYEISTTVRSSENIDELYIKIREHLSRIIDTKNIFVAIYNAENDTINLPFSVDEIDHHPVKLEGKTLTAYVLHSEKPLLVKEKDILRMADESIINIYGKMAKCWLGVPLKTAKRTIGVIALQNYDNEDQFSYDDIELLDFVSNEIAIAIERKQAEENLRKANVELKEIHRDLEKKVEIAVSEVRKKDQIIMEQSRQAAIGEMISMIAHHWRQPLNSIAVLVQAIEEAYQFDELSAEYLAEKVKVCMKILTDLSKSIDDFRYLFKTDEEYTDFNIKDNLKKVIGSFEDKFKNDGIKLVVDIEDVHSISGYPTDYCRAVSNIIKNAYEVLIERKSENPTIWIKLYQEDDNHLVSIKDNGGGIDPEIADKLFDLYSSTKEGLNNTGTGLYMSRMIIENNMNGKITAVNHSDGAEFIIKI